MEKLIKYTAFCKDDKDNMVTIRNLQSTSKDWAGKTITAMNPNLRIITILTDDEIQDIKDILDGKSE